MLRTNGTKKLLCQVWRLTKSYWQSEEKKKAYLLLAAILTLTLAVVFMLVLLNQWNNAFYTALQNYQTDEIFHQLWRFTGLAFAYIVLAVYAYYLQQVLLLHWRKWLTNKYIDRWLTGKIYYRLEMFGKEMDNPDQRISEDVNLFVTQTLGFFIGIVKALCTLVSFVVILWQLSGAFSVQLFGQAFHIPGYMVWVAVAYAVLGTYLTHRVGHKLVGLNFLQQRREADFRFSMMRMRENAESVAFYDGEKVEGQVFKKRFSLLLKNFWAIVQKQKQLVWLNSGYSQIAIIFPFVLAIPRFLSRELTLGGLMQVATAFGRVQDSLSYFVDMYTSLTEWQAVVTRLTGFEEDMTAMRETNSQSHMQREQSQDGNVHLNHLEVDLPNGNILLQPMNFVLTRGQNVLIKGSSGSGKSTLLRALAGIWPYAKGQLALPHQDRILFIPQRPYLPLGTLRDALQYPGKKEFTDAKLQEALEKCKVGYLGVHLHEEGDWSHVFSIGEQQRLAFARAYLMQPEWLFMDESTSALDEATEAALYQLLTEEMQQTTVVSVGHRSTLKRYHPQTLLLDRQTHQASLRKNGDKEEEEEKEGL